MKRFIFIPRIDENTIIDFLSLRSTSLTWPVDQVVNGEKKFYVELQLHFASKSRKPFWYIGYSPK